MKKFLLDAGGINAVISYLEYICQKCGPKREIINENAYINKRNEEIKKGIHGESLSIYQQMLK